MLQVDCVYITATVSLMSVLLFLGIYDATRDCAISFAEPKSAIKEGSEEEPYSATVHVMSMGAAEKRRRKLTLDAVTFFAQFYESRIVRQDLRETFERKGSVLVYRYTGAAADAETLGPASDPFTADGVSPDYAPNQSKAADIARWFADNASTAFSKYDFRKANCEHFATFCKTCRCDIDSIRSMIAAAPQKSGKAKESMLRWSSVSKARSLQAERYVCGVINILKRPSKSQTDSTPTESGLMSLGDPEGVFGADELDDRMLFQDTEAVDMDVSDESADEDDEHEADD